MEKRVYQLLKLSGLVKSSAEAQVMLDQERVRVNNIPVHSLKYKINTKFQDITVDNKQLQPVELMVYILLNKPKGYSCQAGERTYALDLITADEHVKRTLFAVGRLDMDSEGALLITNDGKLAHKILSQKIPKTYNVLVDGAVTPEEINVLKSGVIITIELDGRLTKYRTKPAQCKIIKSTNNMTLLELTICEGKKRQVRKMCEAIHHKVLSLVRTKIGNLSLGSLKPGEFIYLTHDNIVQKL